MLLNFLCLGKMTAAVKTFDEIEVCVGVWFLRARAKQYQSENLYCLWTKKIPLALSKKAVSGLVCSFESGLTNMLDEY